MANKLHVKTGDNVMIISGKDKGKKGKVLQAGAVGEGIITQSGNRTQNGYVVQLGATIKRIVADLLN